MSERKHGDLISREALALDTRRNLMPNIDVDGTVSVEDAERYFLSRIEKAPAVDAVEVVHGHWTLMGSGTGVCSKCHRTTVAVWDMDNVLKYCPHCGARMDGE